MDKTLDLDELERVARAAGDAEWEVVDYEGGSLVIHADRENRVCFMATPGDSPGQMARIEARAVHIATFDPPTILTLIAAARPAVVSDEVVLAVFDEFNRQFRGMNHVEAMRAALALLPGGEGEGSSRNLPSRTAQEPPSPPGTPAPAHHQTPRWLRLWSA